MSAKPALRFPAAPGRGLYPRPRLWHEARVALGAGALLPLLALPGLAAVQRLLWLWGHNQGSPADAAQALAIGLPLAGGLAAAQLMTIEHEEGFSELRRSYPEAAWQLPLWRAGMAWLLLIAAALLGLLAYRLAIGQPLNLAETLLPALAPGLYLTGLSLLVSGMSRSYWAAAGLVMVYWFFELENRGQVSGALFLFNRVWPAPGVTNEQNQALLLAAGLLLFLLNGLIYTARLRWRGPV